MPPPKSAAADTSQRQKDFAALIATMQSRRWAAELAAKIAMSSPCQGITAVADAAERLTQYFYDFVANTDNPATLPPSNADADPGPGS